MKLPTSALSLAWPAALAVLALAPRAPARAEPAVTFDASFEDGSLGQVDVLGPNHFRVHIVGQSDEHGRNRQASWTYFRMDHVAGRDLRITLTDLVGEYDNRPGAVAMTAATHPVYSYDHTRWSHFTDTSWDAKRDELTLHLACEADRLWVAVEAPYPYSRMVRLLAEIGRRPCARVEIIGRTVLGRGLPLVTVTDFSVSDAAKKSVWLVCREHAWEAGTSYAAEGALRFITSDDPRAQALRRTTLFHIIPMADPDGCATGKVRYNAHGYDFNRHWGQVDLSTKVWLQRMPEVWYMKKAILANQARHPIDLLVNFHEDEGNEYMETMIDHGAALARQRRFFRMLAAQSTFAPTRPDVTVAPHPARPTMEILGPEDGVPVVLMEERIARNSKLGGWPTAEERLAFGRQLIEVMAEAAR
ncbi:MAG: M14-type cytosolic carboxypeptidase [Opitutaceae bacterium]